MLWITLSCESILVKQIWICVVSISLYSQCLLVKESGNNLTTFPSNYYHNNSFYCYEFFVGCPWSKWQEWSSWCNGHCGKTFLFRLFCGCNWPASAEVRKRFTMQKMDNNTFSQKNTWLSFFSSNKIVLLLFFIENMLHGTVFDWRDFWECLGSSRTTWSTWWRWSWRKNRRYWSTRKLPEICVASPSWFSYLDFNVNFSVNNYNWANLNVA